MLSMQDTIPVGLCADLETMTLHAGWSRAELRILAPLKLRAVNLEIPAVVDQIYLDAGDARAITRPFHWRFRKYSDFPLEFTAPE